ncbi:fumarylacetoacetate hydrolase family protein [Halobacillus massiliensis]|uniref:fumarylacetoacetate hydrolase family protein n=1 Tax=Halobacillus massiliensis TaxID=1926286 RepID=UPI0009E4C444|nr:fumarylacetoacetate hydrolase family protein [Halobacillus massiliensis]
MKLATILKDGIETGAIVDQKGILPLVSLNRTLHKKWPTDLFQLLDEGELSSLQKFWESEGREEARLDSFYLAENEVVYRPPYRQPKKIWGIGLNYVDHASDLNETAPNTEPASFMKPATTIIGDQDTIEIPLQSERTTGEAELGIIIGKTCKNLSEEEAEEAIAGYTTIIDMTAEDILQRNPRYLTRSKSFDTFFSFGPWVLTADEIDNLSDLNVATVINGEYHRKNVIANMTFSPYYLTAFHSQVMTLKPGDIISTGTPGAIVIRDGDVIECEIDGFPLLTNHVIDLKEKERG